VNTLTTYTVIALGSAIGGVGRHWFGLQVAQRMGPSFPWGTLFVNVTGSFLIGFVAAITDTRPDSQTTREFLMVGILGGYTTFSAFSLQTIALVRDGRLLFAGANVALSVVLCLLAVWAGYAIGKLTVNRL
jgi:CrcB protein